MNIFGFGGLLESVFNMIAILSASLFLIEAEAECVLPAASARRGIKAEDKVQIHKRSSLESVSRH